MKPEVSAGAVVINDGKFLLLKYRAGHWGLVKGHVELGESVEQTITRELEEETGITDSVFIHGFSEEVGYYFKSRRELVGKRVIFLLIKSNTIKVKLSHEHVNYEWLSFNEAVKKITFENIKQVLRKAQSFLTRTATAL
ncbi:MAG: NUDIX domain-containing protein [Candidatus Nanoarchaeia archaeon]|jgi:8-oxo-dGTP pyrophosphatase MutT (NUDIX family)